MNLSQRDRRALVAMGGAALVFGAIALWPSGDTPGSVVGGPQTVSLAEKRLARVRQLAVAVPGREQTLTKARAELAKREKGLIQGESANQAQARLLEVVKRLWHSQSPPVDVRSSDLGRPVPADKAYGEVSITVSANCRIEQLVNFLAELSNQPELMATSNLQVGAAGDKDKMMSVRLTITGMVARSLVPDKKETLF
jgi:hypothetical protein